MPRAKLIPVGFVRSLVAPRQFSQAAIELRNGETGTNGAFRGRSGAGCHTSERLQATVRHPSEFRRHNCLELAKADDSTMGGSPGTNVD
jgi:hypothetical protein